MSVALSSFVRTQGAHSTLDLIVGGARCGGCLAKIENGLRDEAGVTDVRMNLSTARLHLVWDGDADRADGFARTLEDMGFSAGPFILDEADAVEASQTRRLMLAMAVAAFGLMNVMILSIAVWSGSDEMSPATQSLLHWVSAAIALPVAAFSGRPFFASAWQALRVKTTNMDVPISLAILLACGLSVWETWYHNDHTYFDAALMLIFLLLVGRFLDARLRAKAGMAARQLASLQVRNARRITDSGTIETVPATDLTPGDRVLIASGERVPADGVVLSGQSELDAALVTGETALQAVGPGDALYSGTINRGAPLTVEIRKASADSFLADIAAMVEAGQQTQARYVRLADRAARAYVPIVHSLALLTFIGWLGVGGTPRTAMLNAIAVLIITCPCALGLAVPAVQVVAVGRLFAKGVLIRSGDALERLATIRHVVFDKTGTLTTGRVSAETDKIVAKDLALIAALAAQSSHPLSQALHDIETDFSADAVEEVAGQGLQGQVGEHFLRLGQARFVGAADAPGLWARVGDHPPFLVPTSDPVRPEALATLQALRAMGIDLSMLSGDSDVTANAVAAEVGLSDVHARVDPAGKLDRISALQAAGQAVLMVGDGLNDAPALAHANASAALASGSDISRSASDIILQGDTLSALPFAVEVARAARRRVGENFALAIGYNMFAVPLAVFGLVTPLVAALAMSGSSLIVTLNALRMRRVGAYDGPSHPGQTYDPDQAYGTATK